jgi:PEGA domain/Protein kinase domain
VLTYPPPQSIAFRVEEFTKLTEDRLQFDGPRATYGRFRILHQIGAGSVGPVFRGEDGETREPVVIKIIRVGLPPERVAVVASALAALRDRLPSHPALAPLIDTGVVDVEPFIVSPFIDGDSLDVALREFGPANMADALPRLRTLADAMDAAAAVGVAHGSLHLRDIMVSVDETVLTGMGIAAVLERVGVRPPVRRPYCAPEVALGHGISPAADQYALAAIAHEWLSGRRLAGSGAAGFQVPAVSDAGAEALHAVFARAMSDAPESRYPTATAFVEAIAALAGHAAPRSKTHRRAAMIDAPRLSFDEPAEDAEAPAPDDDVVPADEPPPAGIVDEADPLDTPLIVTPSAAAMAWEPEVAVPDAPRPFAALDDEPVEVHDDHRDDVPPSADGWDAAPAPDAPAAWSGDASADAGSEPSTSTWKTWAAVLLVATFAALAGGWALLKWGTPSSPAVTTTTASTPDAPAPAAEPAPETPRAATPAPERPAPALPPPPAEPAAPPAATPAAPRATAPVVVAPPPAAPRRAAPPQATPAPRQAARPAPPKAAPAPRRAAPARQSARPAAAAATNAGRLLVRSTPGGAEVFVNGERRGVTPLALRDLPFGAYAVRVVRAGFAPIEQRVAIDAGRPARSLELALTRGTTAAAAAPSAAEAALPGSLLVESRPAGARVLVDGADIGVTPVTMPALAAGPHTVRIERAGYVPITTTARIEARTRARVAVTLTAERPR